MLKAEAAGDKEEEKHGNPAKGGARRGVAIIADHAFFGRQRRDAVLPDILDGLILLVVYVVLVERVVVVFAQIAVGDMNTRLVKIVVPCWIVVGRTGMPIDHDSLSFVALVHEWLGIFVGAGHIGQGATQSKLPVILRNDFVF